MSEWFDSQKKPNSDFRKLPQERIDKANPRRTELTREEQKRLSKLEDIAARLKRGENVQNRMLQTWLSEDEYAQIEAEWLEQKELREELKDKPSELKRYEEKLKEATFYYNRAESYSNKGKHTTAKKFYNKCASLCDNALEILQEILHSDPYLQTWFDRELLRISFLGPGFQAAEEPGLVGCRRISTCSKLLVIQRLVKSVIPTNISPRRDRSPDNTATES